MKKSFSRHLLKPSSMLVALLASQGFGTFVGSAHAIDCSRFGGGSGSSGQNIPAECIPPRITDPRSGFDNGARLPPEQRRNDSVIQVNRADPAIIPPSPCAAGVLNWQAGGLTCSASAPAVYSGDAVTITDTAQPNTGVASFSCDNGTYIVQGGATCNPPPPPPANCVGGIAQQWTVGGNTCEGVLNATAHAANTTVNDTTAPLTGSATYTCNNGNYTYLTGSCTAPPPPANCGTAARSWNVGGNACDALIPAANHSNVSTGVDSTAPTTGSAQYTCNNGTFFQTGPQASSTTCNAAPPPGPAACTAGQTLTWTNSGNTCQAMSTSTSSGNTITITDASAPGTGSATYVCNNGSFSVQSSNCSSGTPPAAAPCSAGQTLTWSASGNTCQATSTGTSSGNTITISDSTSPGTGNATFLCSNGAFSPQSVTCTAGTPTATPPPPPPPPAPPPPAPAPVTCNYGGGVLTWGACSADPGPVSRGVGGTVDLTDSTQPSTGSIRFTCQSNGNFTPSNDFCNAGPVAAQPCAGQPVFWNVGGANCSGGTSNTADQVTVAVNSTNGTTGAASFTCDNGNFVLQPNPTCAAPAPAGPVRVLGPVSSGGVGEPFEPLVDFRGGLDDLYYLHSFEVYSNGPTANPFIKFVAGHTVETTYNVSRPTYVLDVNNVEPFRSLQFTLPTTVTSPINMGDTALSSDSRFGRVRSYIMSGGCSGTSCSYNLYFNGIADRGTARFSGSYGFLAQCPSNSNVAVFVGDEFATGGTQYFSLESPNQTCYSNNPNVDGGGTPLPCGPNDHFSERTNACHSPVGVATNRQPFPQGVRTISFTR